MSNFTHITITPNAFDLNNNFTEQMDEALRQEKIARAALELLEALKELALAYQRTAQYRFLDEVKEDEQRFMNAKAAIAKAEGKQ